ncbi:hypothetical protein [Pollutibacter soli]
MNNHPASPFSSRKEKFASAGITIRGLIKNSAAVTLLLATPAP